MPDSATIFQLYGFYVANNICNTSKRSTYSFESSYAGLTVDGRLKGATSTLTRTAAICLADKRSQLLFSI